MGYELYNLEDNSEFRWNSSGWPSILKLAKKFGWTPEGTDIPSWFTGAERKEIVANKPDYKWNYIGNDGQVITATDAAKIANALKKGLNVFHDNKTDNNISSENIDNADMDPTTIEVFKTILNPDYGCLEGFRPDVLMKFIEFCEKGAFIVR